MNKELKEKIKRAMPRKTVLNKENLFKVLTEGIYTKLDEDKELTHYCVFSFNNDELLVYREGIDWSSGDTNYSLHKIKQKDKDFTWFLNKKGD